MRQHFFALIAWFIGLLAFAKSVKLITLSYPAEKMVKFKRFTGWVIFVAAAAGLLCVAAKSFYPKKGDKDFGAYHHSMMMEHGGMGMTEGGQMSCPAEKK
ncbi:MAG: hypothetical protein A3F16_03665 [Deltaproteobacteria bacterium RIFCSPHIGHO2_12_FULL_43_9]|nr:MAG: hypothetical protein A3F16_03665 [Deltaproteobacteria bacterium RIFCSPHIGHO2_12_FULL_43_9]